MKIKSICIIGIISTFLGCHKENSDNWQVIFSDVVENVDHLILNSHSDFSISEPYLPATGSANIVYGEIQELGPTFLNNTYEKSIVIEIPDSLGILEFRFVDEQIYLNLNCYIYYFASGSKFDGFYRIHRGYVSGTKESGHWEIDFNVTFGGDDNNKFNLTKDAIY